ncbi:hypothetical protein acdb102_15730 [Acidothermaceae bacterium B102]|nr:hypothetical protein acdb102_15730 [Acidothermaceae bacterium B102]
MANGIRETDAVAGPTESTGTSDTARVATSAASVDFLRPVVAMTRSPHIKKSPPETGTAITAGPTLAT